MIFIIIIKFKTVMKGNLGKGKIKKIIMLIIFFCSKSEPSKNCGFMEESYFVCFFI